MAVIESRLICGLSLLAPDQRKPFKVTSRGVGEAILTVVAEGASHVVVGLGGSAMIDGGWGMATALGWEFRDAENTVLVPGRDRMSEIRFARGSTPSLPGITALCDVSVPFGGPDGAVIFAEQKGVVREEIRGLIPDIERFASLRGPWAVLSRLPGAGAAGGLGFGLAAFAGARLQAGADWVLGRSQFAECLDRAALVVTGEGRFDSTSLLGKLTGVVVQRAGAKGVPVIVLAPTTDGAGEGIAGLSVVSGDGRWAAADIAAKTRESVAGALSLLGY